MGIKRIVVEGSSSRLRGQSHLGPDWDEPREMEFLDEESFKKWSHDKVHGSDGDKGVKFSKSHIVSFPTWEEYSQWRNTRGR